MGGSMALAMRDFADRITGIDLDEQARCLALARGMVDCATDDLFDGVNRADVVVLATPVRAIVELLEMQIGSYLRSNTWSSTSAAPNKILSKRWRSSQSASMQSADIR